MLSPTQSVQRSEARRLRKTPGELKVVCRTLRECTKSRCTAKGLLSFKSSCKLRTSDWQCSARSASVSKRTPHSHWPLESPATGQVQMARNRWVRCIGSRADGSGADGQQRGQGLLYRHPDRAALARRQTLHSASAARFPRPHVPTGSCMAT